MNEMGERERASYTLLRSARGHLGIWNGRGATRMGCVVYLLVNQWKNDAQVGRAI
jgi:hypothetical protein